MVTCSSGKYICITEVGIRAVVAIYGSWTRFGPSDFFNRPGEITWKCSFNITFNLYHIFFKLKLSNLSVSASSTISHTNMMSCCIHHANHLCNLRDNTWQILRWHQSDKSKHFQPLIRPFGSDVSAPSVTSISFRIGKHYLNFAQSWQKVQIKVTDINMMFIMCHSFGRELAFKQVRKSESSFILQQR